MKQIIVVKPGTLKAKDKEKLSKNGCIVIEHPEPSYGLNFKNLEGVVKMKYTNCCVCGERIYLPEERINALQQSKARFFCSFGHAQSYK